MKKSDFKVLYEALTKKGVKFPTDNVDFRRLTVSEIKRIIKEEFEDVKKVEDVEAQEVPFGDVELEHEIEWLKSLKIDEFLNPKMKKSAKRKK